MALFTLLLILPLYAQESVKHATNYFQGQGNVNIFYQGWNVDHPSAVMVIVHGFTGSSDQFKELAENFSKLGLSVYALDHRGHGQSEGLRYTTNNFDDYVTDLKTFVDMIKQWEPGKDIFMLGHSLGGEITLKYALTYPNDLKGIIASSPGIGAYLSLPVIGKRPVPFQVDPAIIPFMETMARTFPNLSVPMTELSQPITLEFAIEVAKNMIYLQDNAQNITVPCLFIIGSADPLIPLKAVKTFYDNIQIKDKAFIVYDGLDHNIFHTPYVDIVYKDLNAWLLPRL